MRPKDITIQEYGRGKRYRDCTGVSCAIALGNRPSKARICQWLELGENSFRVLSVLYTGHCRLRRHLLLDDMFSLFGTILLSPANLKKAALAIILDLFRKLDLECGI